MTRKPRVRESRRAVHRHRQAGGAVVELVLLTPALVMILLLVVALGRLAQAKLRVDDASYQAARAASLQATPGQAVTAADTTARAALGAGGSSCTVLAVSVNTADDVPGGTVQVTVTCTVSFAHMALLALPGTTTMASTATAPVDRYGAETAPGSPHQTDAHTHHPLGPSPTGPRTPLLLYGDCRRAGVAA